MLDAMTTGTSPAVPDRPSLDGLEEKWTQRWETARVVQV
jgi:hypothetical protein